MPMIYKRFTEKSAEEWRQIYKALVLLEYLVKNGSERVVDYARSHSAVIDMLKHFHYIDQNGKDQGVNIRNRAKELVNLLGDVDLIRTERKKARSNKVKIAGIGNDGGFGGTGKKYGGFGSDSLEFGGGGYSERRVYGDGGGFDGSNYVGPGYSNDDDFEEYQVGESSEAPAASSSSASAPPKPLKKDEPVGDFISFDDDDAAGAASAAGGSAPPAATDDDDDFDDFQSAAPATAGAPAGAATTTTPASGNRLDNLSDLFAQSATPSFSATPAMSAVSSPPVQSPSMASMSSSMFASPAVSTRASVSSAGGPVAGGASGSGSGTGSTAAKPNAGKSDAFASLWETAASKPKKQDKSGPTSLASLAQERKETTMWGAAASSSKPSSSSGGSQPAPSGGSSSQVDDLLSF